MTNKSRPTYSEFVGRRRARGRHVISPVPTQDAELQRTVMWYSLFDKSVIPAPVTLFRNGPFIRARTILDASRDGWNMCSRKALVEATSTALHVASCTMKVPPRQIHGQNI